MVLRALGLGDLLTAIPAIRMVQRALPGHELVLAMPEGLQPLAKLADIEHRLLDTHGLAALSWQGPAPEYAVNLHGKGPQSHRLLAEVGPRRLLAFGCTEAGVVGPQWRSDEHEVSRWTRMVAESFPEKDVVVRPGDLHLRVPAREPAVAGAVVIHPGAAFASRRWPPARFAAVAKAAAAAGLPVVVTGSQQESGLVAQVGEAAGLSPECLLAGSTSLVELAALIANARLLVCGDTGVAHLASAFATPSVVLFGPVPPSAWGPPASGPHRVIWHGPSHGDPYRGDPWGSTLDPALAAITVDEVWTAADQLLRSTAALRPASPETTRPSSTAPPGHRSEGSSRAAHAPG